MSVNLRDPEAASAVALGDTSMEDINNILKSSKALWVKNNTANPIFQLSLEYSGREGRRVFQVPRTNIPFNLTAYVPAEALSDCDAFRKMVTRGALVVISETEAREELEGDPNARRMFKIAFDDANDTMNARKDEAEKERNSRLGQGDYSQAAGEVQLQQAIAAAGDPKLAEALRRRNLVIPRDNENAQANNPKFDALSKRVEMQAISPGDIMRELNMMASELTASELHRIAANWPHDAAAWAKERIAVNLAKAERKAAKLAAAAATTESIKAKRDTGSPEG